MQPVHFQPSRISSVGRRFQPALHIQVVLEAVARNEPYHQGAIMGPIKVHLFVGRDNLPILVALICAFLGSQAFAVESAKDAYDLTPDAQPMSVI
jgi:hypothetical protein